MEWKAKELREEEERATRARLLAPMPPQEVVTYRESLPPVYAVRCARSGTYLGGAMSRDALEARLRANRHWKITSTEMT